MASDGLCSCPIGASGGRVACDPDWAKSWGAFCRVEAGDRCESVTERPLDAYPRAGDMAGFVEAFPDFVQDRPGPRDTAGCVEFKPSLAYRFWRALGFGYARARFEPEPEAGFAETKVRAVLCWKDRLRVLVSGKIEISCAHIIEPQPKRMETVSEFRVLPPTEHIPKPAPWVPGANDLQRLEPSP
jgi:hypothetical protein